LGGLGLPRRGGTAFTTWSAGTRRVRVPMLPFSKAPLGPQGDLDGLFAVGGHGGAVVAFQGAVYDTEPDLRLGPSWAAASSTVTPGEPNIKTAELQRSVCNGDPGGPPAGVVLYPATHHALPRGPVSGSTLHSEPRASGSEANPHGWPWDEGTNGGRRAGGSRTRAAAADGRG
jgi:hypothetical protein